MTEAPVVDPVEASPDLIPKLSGIDYKRLRASIQAKGVQLPILVADGDPEGVAPDGEVIDGHHRQAIALELGIPCPESHIVGLTADGRRQMAFDLNFYRRQLQFQQQRDILLEVGHRLTTNPLESDRAISTLLGLDPETVGKERKRLEKGGEIPQTRVATVAKGGSARVLADPDADEAAPPPGSSEHLRVGSVMVLYTIWVPSTEARLRGALPYEREREKATRHFGPFVMPPEAQSDPKLFLTELIRQFYPAWRLNPPPPL